MMSAATLITPHLEDTRLDGKIRYKKEQSNVRFRNLIKEFLEIDKRPKMKYKNEPTGTKWKTRIGEKRDNFTSAVVQNITRHNRKTEYNTHTETRKVEKSLIKFMGQCMPGKKKYDS